MAVKPTTIGMRLDIETRSGTDVKRGAYRYAEDPDFEVLVTAYSMIHRYPGGTLKITRPRLLSDTIQRDVDKFADLLLDERFQKHAYNANFERICLSRWVGMGTGEYIDPLNWRCSAIKANVNGVFGTLADVSKHLRSPVTKDTEGKRLIRLFSSPDNKTKKFHEPHPPCWCGLDHSADFARFGEYCKQDVVAEAMVDKLLGAMPDSVQAEYEMDQRINDRGFKHNKRFAIQAVTQVKAEKDRLMSELTDLTGLANPNSNMQFGAWLVAQKYPMVSLDKAHRAEALLDPFVPPLVAKALTMKGAASLSSVTKHQAALDTRCADGRIRGALQFYGAHTGREAGRGIQPQNLPRYEAPRADMYRLLTGTAGTDAPEIAKGSVRASIVPAKGHVFVVPDYNAIEARVLGWLCGEQWVVDEFKGDGKIYEATAAAMFGVDKADLMAALKVCGKCGHCAACDLRAKGKVSDLALGYGGGSGALVTMGAEGAGIDVGNYPQLHAEWVAAGSPGKFWQYDRERHDYPELKRLRDLYRQNRPATARFWKLCEQAWDLAAMSGTGARFGDNGVLSMIRNGKHNRLILPSGRSIWYRFARSHKHPDKDEIDFRSFIGKSGGIGHTRVETHGGKLTENATQAVARDVLFDLMLRIEDEAAKGWPAKLVMHVHDEVVLEVPEDQGEQVLADVLGMMDIPPTWGKGLVVKGAGAVMERYGK